jgi:hypothetical protein
LGEAIHTPPLAQGNGWRIRCTYEEQNMAFRCLHIMGIISSTASGSTRWRKILMVAFNGTKLAW